MDGFLDGSDRQHDVTAHGGAGLGPDHVLDRRESRKLRHEFVVASRQAAKRKRTAAISECVLRGAVTHLCEPDGGTW